MDGVSTTFAVIQVVDTCIKYGKKLIALVEAYRQANDKVAELILRIRTVWLKTERQISVLRDLWDSIDPNLQAHQREVLRRLESKLAASLVRVTVYNDSQEDADVKFGKLDLKLSRPTRIKFAAFERSLKDTAGELEAWYGIFDPSWYLITLDRSPNLDRSLASQESDPDLSLNTLKNVRGALHSSQDESSTSQSVIRPADFLTGEAVNVEGSTSFLRQVKDQDQVVIVDRTNHRSANSASAGTVQAYVCQLAKLLSHCNPGTIGLLNCVGIIKADTHFEILFAIPPTLKEPTSLRSLLTRPTPSLDNRFFLAHSLARAVMSCHSAKLVHKNIRPETFLVFQSAKSEKDKESLVEDAFLVGFEQFRPAEGHSGLVSDMRWERNIYRHPKRQGAQPEEFYVMQHDIYSLGVCLLEIGLWSPFVVEKPADSPDKSATAQPGPKLDIKKQLDLRNERQAALEIKEKLCTMAETLLPSQMGQAYTEIAKSCLTCLDSGKDNLFSGDQDLEDENGITIGVAYIEKILVELETSSIVKRKRKASDAAY